MKIRLHSTEDIERLVKFTTKHSECNFDIAKGSYVVDAASYLGVLSLDTSSELDMIVHGASADVTKAEMELREQFDCKFA